MMENGTIIIFSPEGLRVEEYRKKYPELDTIPEFKQLKDRTLIFVWYYSNPTSYMVYQYSDKEERALHAAKKAFGDSGAKFGKDFVERKLPDQTKVEEAIRRMEKILPTVRDEARTMVNKCFDDFRDLLDKPFEDFKNKNGDPDITSYMAIRKNVLKELADMVTLVEIGFGVSNTSEKKIDGQKLLEGYLKNKTND